MPEISDKAEFSVKCDSARLITTANGDKLIFENINLDAPTTASIAWLANQEPGTLLDITIELTP